MPAGQSATIDIAALRAGQAPDASGRTLPLAVSAGQVHWSIVGGTAYRGLVGRVEQVDVQHGVSSTYACPMPTADNFYAAWIEPGIEYASPGQWVKFTAMEQDQDAYTHEVGNPYDISDILSWSSFSPGIASSGGAGWFYAQSGGYATVSASGESNGWEDYQGEGNPGNHVSISEYAQLEVTLPCAIPVNFRQVGFPETLPNAGLKFTYEWDSSTGNRADLIQCDVGEKVGYPFEQNPFPSPPLRR